MAQGNITKKDKVNIPDWVGTNLYLENDFVINDNKFYRANGDIAAGATTLTIGTAGATWTEMSPSAGGQFTLTNSTLSTNNDMEIGDPNNSTARLQVHGHIEEISRPKALIGDGWFKPDFEATTVIPVGTPIASGFTFDTTENSFRLNDDVNDFNFISVDFTHWARSASVDHHGTIQYIVGYRDNATDGIIFPVGCVRGQRFSGVTDLFFTVAEYFEDLPNVPGREFFLFIRTSGFEFYFNAIGGGGTVSDLPTGLVDTTGAGITAAQGIATGGITLRAYN